MSAQKKNFEKGRATKRNENIKRPPHKIKEIEINILDYIFDYSEEKKNFITKYLLKNSEQRQAIEGLIDLCLDQKFDRIHLEKHLKVLGIDSPFFTFRVFYTSERIMSKFLK